MILPGCSECSERPNNEPRKECPPNVVEINSCDVVLFHRVDVPVEQGTDEDYPPENLEYRNTLLYYLANDHVYLYNSDGIPTRLDGIRDVDRYFDDLIGRPKYGGVEMTSATNIPNVDDVAEDIEELRTRIENEETARAASDEQLSIALNTEATTRQEADAELSDSLTEEIATREASDAELSDSIETEAEERASADDSLQASIQSEIAARQEDVQSLQDSLDTESETRASEDEALNDAIEQEITNRTAGDSNLSSALDEETTAREDADTAINTAINKSFIKNIALKSGASTTTVELTKSSENIRTGATSSADFALPVASSTQAGVINSTMFQTIQNTADKVNAIEGGSVAITGLGASPTQAELTSAWKNATGKTDLINQAGIFDTSNDKIWTYFSNDDTWHYVNAGGVAVSTATNTSLGIVKGDATNAGKAFVESDGSISINGWDSHETRITNLESDVDSLQDDKEDALPTGTNVQVLRGDKTFVDLDSMIYFNNNPAIENITA